MNNKTKKNNMLRIKLMESTIQDYLNKKIDIGQLVNDLESLIYSIEETSDNFIDNLISLWGTLEVFYAWMLDQNKTDITIEEKEQTKKVLIKINNLIKQYKKQYLSDMEAE